MKTLYLKSTALLFIFCFWGLTSAGQISQELLQQYLNQNKDRYNADVMQFYESGSFRTAWIQNKDSSNRNYFLNALKTASAAGLREADYQDELVSNLRKTRLSLNSIGDSIAADIQLTAIALHFYKDVAYGNAKPPMGYNGLKYTPDCYNVPALVAEYTDRNMLSLLPARLSSSLPEIMAMEKKLQQFNRVLSDTVFREVKITSNKIAGSNLPLVIKLYQLGIIETANNQLPDSILIKGVKEAQKQFGLLTDGVLRSSTLQQLNIPLSTRMQQLVLSFNYYKWLACFILDQPVITVNIPAAYMKVYGKNKVMLEMRMIVGKRSTPTPTLISKVNEVILYPYWHVPNTIATKELLPKIRRNIAFIDEGNYQVLNKAGKIVDPYSINWQSLSQNNFPYIIRQSTGCDNALGLLKLNFYNPFDVYLHDTNGKSSFLLNRRFLSHGCMRMDKPMELGRLVLAKNRIAIDTLEQKGCLRNQAPISVPAQIQFPVIVWYNPAGIDSTGRILFFEDIYEKFGWMKNK